MSPVPKYRRHSDPVVKVVRCDTCRAVIAGFTEFGLVTWCDVTPLTHEVEQVFHKVGRPTYRVRPRAGRTAWVDWRNPVTSTEPPHEGIVLARHPHNAPGRKAPDPDWLVSDYRIVNAPADPDTLLF